MQTARRRAVVVGGGPVGCLAAIMLANRGWDVALYEARDDLRLPKSRATTQLRSINLAISHRGIAAIQAVDPLAGKRFLEVAIPMRGRMIHQSNGDLESQLYDKDGQCINSIDRAVLNEELLDRAAASKDTRLFFRHKVQSIDFDQKTMIVRDLTRGTDSDVPFDLCIGADGSYSLVRRQMMRVVRMNYQQQYITDEYIELKMPAGQRDGQPTYLLDPNHLHIWPRHSFMLIALPNKDKTFTCTLFVPKAELNHLDCEESIVSWFRTHFPDALELIGEKDIVKDVSHNPRSPLICTQSRPYHYKDRAILLGDAAHSMVPFYGQGLNCGLEDVRVLHILLQEAGVDPFHQGESVEERLAAALERYSATRHEDLLAIADLAMNNYMEMRHLVTTPMYIFRRALDNLFHRLSSRQRHTLDSLTELLSTSLYMPGLPREWLPLYTMVTFRPDLSYATVRRKMEMQTRVLSGIGWTTGTIVLAGATLLITRGIKEAMGRRT